MTLAVDKLAWQSDRQTGGAPCRDHHGRQRALGRRARPAARRGHRQGVESVRRTVEAALELGITHLTLFSFSSENWSRPKQEINDLFGLLRRFIRRDLADLHKNGVKIRVIGTRSGLDADLLRMIDDAVELTKDNAALNLTIAFNYGARDEIARAARRIAEDVAKGALAPAEVTEERFGCLSRHRRSSRPRPPDPHERRAAPVELPALAACLCRVRVRRRLLAGLLARAAGSGDRRISAAQPALRRHLGEIHRVTRTESVPDNSREDEARRKSELAIRLASAVVLAALGDRRHAIQPLDLSHPGDGGQRDRRLGVGTAHARQRLRRHGADRGGQRRRQLPFWSRSAAPILRSSCLPPRPWRSG